MIKGKEGMHVSQLTRMVFNLHVNFFDQQLNYRKLHNYIRFYLWRQSNMRRSPFKRIRYGYYALKSDIAVQLDIPFDDSYIDEEPTTQPEVPVHKIEQLELQF